MPIGVTVLRVQAPGDRISAAFDDPSASVDVVESVEAALTAVDRRRYDAVVTAQSLPDGTGLSLIEALPDDQTTVLCPDDGSESLAGRAIAAGVDAYVPTEEAAAVLGQRLREIIDPPEASNDDPPSTVDDEDRLPTPEERFRLLVEQSPLAIVEWTTAFEVTGWNPAAEALFGYSEEAALGRTPAELILPEDERSDVEAAWQELIDGERSVLRGVNENVTAAGDRITCEWHSVPLHDSSGRIIGVLSFARDVTDEVRRADTLSMLHESTRALFRANDRATVAGLIVDAATDVLEAPAAAVFGPDEDGFVPLATGGNGLIDVEWVDADSPIGTTFDRDEPRYLAAIDGVSDSDPPAGSLACYPLSGHGVLVLAAASLDAFDDIDRGLGRVLAAAGAAAFDRADRERSLRRSRAIVEAIGDGVYALDEDGRIIAANDVLRSMAGYEADELEGKHVSAFLDDEDVERGRRIVREILSGADSTTRTEAFELRTTDGERIPCEITVSALEERDEFAGTVGIVRDVTERKRMEAALRERKREIEAIYEAATDLEACRDPETVCSVAVEAALDVLPADAGAAFLADDDRSTVADDCLSIAAVAPADADPLDGSDAAIARRAYEHGEALVVDDPAAARIDGDAVFDEYESVLAVPVSDHGVLEVAATAPEPFDEDDVGLAELLLAHVEDTLDRLAYEAELRVERDRLAALFENVPDPVVTTEYVDGEPIVTGVNDAFVDVFGYDRAEILDESIDEFIVPDEHTEEAERLGQRAADGEAFEIEVERETATGLRDFLLRVVPVDLGNDTAVTYAVYTDITERKRRRQRVEVLNRVLRHDLRNGMNIVRGSAEIIKDRAGETEPESHARTIVERADELISLAEKTRSVERTLGHDGDSTSRVDIVDTTRCALHRVHEEFPDAAFEFDHPDTAKARASRMLETALYHLLHNAVVHNDERIPEVVVTVTADEHAVEIRIADNGPGIPQAEYELITEEREITQLRHASGLGLWVANWAITQSGGNLTFEDNDPKGTITTVRLPVSTAESDIEEPSAGQLDGEEPPETDSATDADGTSTTGS